MSTNTALYSKLPSIEAQVQEVASAQRRSLIGEMFPNTSIDRFDRTFYPQVIQPLIYSYMIDNLEEYLDFYQPPESLLRKLFLRLNLQVTREVLEGLHSLRSAMSLSDQMHILGEGEFSEQLRKVIELYEDAGIDWDSHVRKWVANLTNEDLDIWVMALRGENSSTIKSTLKLAGPVEQVTGRIVRLQRELLLSLVSALPRYSGR